MMQDLRGPKSLIIESRIISDQEGMGIRVQVWRTFGEYGGRGPLGIDVLVSDAGTAEFIATMFTLAARDLAREDKTKTGSCAARTRDGA